jgi:pimeloyl-ACP methyl ester carboxylesterase
MMCCSCVIAFRGYGPTRFLAPATPRSGQQAALGADLLALLDALQIERAVLGGYDWRGRAACVVAALYPSRARGLVSVNGYNIQNIATAMRPASPEKEHRLWYQYYLHGERGRAGLTEKLAHVLPAFMVVMVADLAVRAAHGIHGNLTSWWIGFRQHCQEVTLGRMAGSRGISASGARRANDRSWPN